jgi:hypothetical protein
MPADDRRRSDPLRLDYAGRLPRRVKRVRELSCLVELALLGGISIAATLVAVVLWYLIMR